MYRICGKVWTPDDIERIRGLIGSSPAAHRAALSRLVAEAFNWRMPDGRLKEMSCRVAMLRMQRTGLIELPLARHVHANGRRSRKFESEESDPQPHFEAPLSSLGQLRLETVARGAPLRLWNEFISRYHYLGYSPMAGAQLRYFIKDGERVLGAMGFGAAAWKVSPRDRHIGWSSELRESRLHLVVNQTRFLILPWVRCQNLATKSLRLALQRLPSDWMARYGYRPVLVETFVDTRYRGTCYKAGNWTYVGETQGRSKYDRFHEKRSPVKSVWLMPLERNYRATLSAAEWN
jgi:hypothetical protein